MNLDEGEMKSAQSLHTNLKLCGSITQINKSAYCHFGVTKKLTETETANNNNDSNLSPMGPLTVAFPKQFQNSNSVSQLINGNEEDSIIGAQMASRLSRKLNNCILVSCSLHENECGLNFLVEDFGLANTCAVLVEKEIERFLSTDD